MPMMWGYGYDWSWGGVVMMLLSSLIWLAFVGVLLWALMRWIAGRSSAGRSTPSGPSFPSGPSALEILNQRYARGEIDQTTFDQMREHLEKAASTRQPELTPVP